MENVVRFPLPHWPEELDEHERSIEEQSWESDTPVIAGDALAIGGTEIVARHLTREPTWHGWLTTLLVPIAALCAVGLMVAVVG